MSTKRLTLPLFIKRSRILHGNKYDYSKTNYTNSKAKVTIICPSHGEFQQTPNGHLTGVWMFEMWASGGRRTIQKARIRLHCGGR